jgi:hypothetical protein
MYRRPGPRYDGAVRGPWIAGPIYDAVLFIGSPLLALILGIAISGTPLTSDEIVVWGNDGTVASIFIGSFIMAHLGLVLVRSHLNQQVFARHPRRFVAVPLVVLLLLCASDWLLALAIVTTVWWDVVHSSLQTFGLGRIYDARIGNPPALGRRLDLGLNLLLYMGPVVAGATFIDHLMPFHAFERADTEIFCEVPVHGEALPGRAGPWAVLVGGGLYLLVYVLGYVRLHRRGYKRLAAEGRAAGAHRRVLDLHLGLQQLRAGVLHHELLPRVAILRPGVVERARQPAPPPRPRGRALGRGRRARSPCSRAPRPTGSGPSSSTPTSSASRCA